MSETRTRRRKRNRQALPPVTITTQVTLEQVHALWEAILADPEPYYVSDYTPRFFQDLVGQLGRGMVLVMGFVGGEMAGGIFLTRIEPFPDTQRPLHCVVDLYVKEAFRGKAAFALARAWKQYLLETVGFKNFYCTIHPEHKASRYLVTQMGMHCVGLVPAFLPRQGQPQDMMLYSMLPPQAQKE
jgi:RimJ/RimL family protein N-acetyltransferase